LTGGEFSRKKKQKRLDAVAAAAILETFLERKRSQ
jgi:RNase H-fold protein (predicted Holliday junction resolvase)